MVPTIKERCHWGSSLAALALMGFFVIETIHILIQICLQGLQFAVDFFAERDTVKLV